MKQLVKLNKRPVSNGFTFILRYIGEDGKRKWETLGHANRRKAEKQCAQREKDLRMGYIEPGSLTLKEFVKDSLAKTGNQIRESTQDEYDAAMKDFIKKIGNIDYKKVTLGHGEKYRQICLDSGNSPATVTKKLKHLKRLFQLGVKRKQLDENTFQYIDMPKYRKKKIRTYSDTECQSIEPVAQLAIILISPLFLIK